MNGNELVSIILVHESRLNNCCLYYVIDLGSCKMTDLEHRYVELSIAITHCLDCSRVYKQTECIQTFRERSS